MFATTYWDDGSSHWNNPIPLSKIKILEIELKDDQEDEFLPLIKWLQHSLRVIPEVDFGL
jgi:hypothetical protein